MPCLLPLVSWRKKLSVDLVKQQEAGAIPRAAQLPVALPVRSVNSDIVRSATPVANSDLQQVQQGDIIKPQAFYRGAPNKGEIKRLDGMFNLLAMGGTDADGKRLLFMAQDRSVQLIREGESRPHHRFWSGCEQQDYKS